MKKFELLSTEPIHGAINIPVLNKMSNGEVAEAILSAVAQQEARFNVKQWLSIESFCNTLQNDSESQYIDPCDNCPDCFVLAFGFKDYTREAILFSGVILFSLIGESLINAIL
jgi:hypothetical protein